MLSISGNADLTELGVHFHGALPPTVVLTQARAIGLPDITDFVLPEQHVGICTGASCMQNVFLSGRAAVYIFLAHLQEKGVHRVRITKN